MLTRPCIPLSLSTIPKLMVSASVLCHHSAMFSKMLGLQFGPAVLIYRDLFARCSLIEFQPEDDIFPPDEFQVRILLRMQVLLCKHSCTTHSSLTNGRQVSIYR